MWLLDLGRLELVSYGAFQTVDVVEDEVSFLVVASAPYGGRYLSGICHRYAQTAA